MIPLAEILGVSVTELLESRRIEVPESMDKEQTDNLVKKVIELSAEERAKIRKKHILTYFLCFIICILEIALIYPIRNIQELIGNIDLMPLFMMEFFSIGFGAYFWIFIKEKLPSYYDENEIGVYVDGILHMNMPGVIYNNNNWPHIVKVMRGWSVFGMVVLPLLYFLLGMVFQPMDSMMQVPLVLLYVLGGLFVPVYIVGRKYQYRDHAPIQKTGQKIRQTIVWVLVIFVVILAIRYSGVTTSISSSNRMLFTERKGWDYWKAEYQYLDGFMQRTLWMEEDDILHVSVETEEGDFSLQIMDADGNVIFSDVKVETKKFDVDVSGKISIRIEAEKHEGSFSFE